jgi:hypothetical protein
MRALQGDQEMRRVVAKRIEMQGGLGLTGGVEFHRESLQVPQSLASNFIDLAVPHAGRRKGVRGGAAGVFIGGGFLAKGARVALREAMNGRGGVGLDLDSVRR